MAEDNSKWLPSLQAALGLDAVSIDPEVLHAFSHDETEDVHILPQVVCRPSSAEEVSAVLRIAHEFGIPSDPGRRPNGLIGRRYSCAGRHIAEHGALESDFVH